MFCLYLAQRPADFRGQTFLHFAPEEPIRSYVQRHLDPRSYTTADITGRGVDRREDMTRLSFAEESFDAVIANDVLEHIQDDAGAMREVFRVLRPGGRFLCTVPVVHEWANTYENPELVTPDERERHFGQFDHVRWYGRDFPERLRRAGFAIEVYRARPEEYAEFRLESGRQIFVATKPEAADPELPHGPGLIDSNVERPRLGT